MGIGHHKEKGIGYETQLMGLGKKPTPVKETYICNVCEQVVIRHREPGSKPYVKWCCGIKMTKIKTKCSVCGTHIKGANHFQGKHHLEAVAAAKAMNATKEKFGM